jgi:hypothetical protein
VAELGFVKIQPIGDPNSPNLDEKTVACLRAVVETGARTTAGLSFAVAAFELLAWQATESGSKEKILEAAKLRGDLMKEVSSSPLKQIRDRAAEVAKRLDAALIIL